jgi:glycosyltransferase involved in cell wall biosynthesis
MATISIITAVRNRANVISEAIDSLRGQLHSEIEHIVIDGASTDNTLSILRDCADPSAVIVSEPDNGIYDALNKGLFLASGEIIGVLHSDDFFADQKVLSDVAAQFADPAVDAVYGDLDYVSRRNPAHVVRRWRSGPFDMRRLDWGWMPPHPTLFIRRSVFERLGGFNTIYRVSADYDLILRYFKMGRINATYIPRVLVKMRLGGESNRSIAKIWRKTREDWQALRSNGVGALGGFGALAWKNLSKFKQFF